MRRGWVILITVTGVLLLAAAALVLYPHEREPEYKGRPLSVWIDQAGSMVWNPTTGRPEYWSRNATADEAMRAITATRTNSLRFLVKWMQYRPHPWTPRTRPLVKKLPARLRNTAFVQDFLGDERYSRIEAAVWSFKVLRAEAAPVVPELTRLMNDPRRPVVSERAMLALSCIGREGFAPLLAAVTNRALPNRGSAARWLWSMATLGTNALPAVPVLARCLKDADPWVALYAARLLGDIRASGDVAVPALVAALHDPRSDVRAEAASALGQFGEARQAVADLRAATHDDDLVVRSAAQRALDRIYGTNSLPTRIPATRFPGPIQFP